MTDVAPVQRSLPSSVNYTKILPLAVESRSRRRTFLPNNGQSFVSDLNNQIRIDISANAFLDTQHSYLRFRMRNTTGQNMSVDFSGGHGFIQRLRISQSGTILSDVFNYGRLVGGILLPSQIGTSAQGERSITEGQRWCNAGGAAAASMATAAPAEVSGAIAITPTNATNVVPAGSDYYFCIPLVNGLLGTTQSKMVPLQLLGSSPIQLEITLANVSDVGVFAAPPNAYTIDECRYIGALVEVGAEVDQQLRAVQSASRGRLVLNGVDYTHFTGNFAAGTQGNAVINIPARKKSMKSLLWLGATQNFVAPVRSACFNLCWGGHLNMEEFYVKIGSLVYPQTPIRSNFRDNLARQEASETLEELAKCMGTLNSAHGVGCLTRMNCYVNDCDNGNCPVASVAGGATATHQFSPFGIDLEAFQKTALESGVDTSSRALQMSLHCVLGRDLGGGIAADPITIDAYVCYDSLYYIDEAGRINVSQ